ncbi:MAG: SHOCT domain-containing protein [Candidatus Aquicultor sp.]
MMHYWGGHALGIGGHGFGIGGPLMVISMVLFWGLIILGIVFLVRMLNRGGGPFAPHGTENRALDILKERYARGEIDNAEYEERKRTLTG